MNRPPARILNLPASPITRPNPFDSERGVLLPQPSGLQVREPMKRRITGELPENSRVKRISAVDDAKKKELEDAEFLEWTYFPETLKKPAPEDEEAVISRKIERQHTIQIDQDPQMVEETPEFHGIQGNQLPEESQATRRVSDPQGVQGVQTAEGSQGTQAPFEAQQSFPFPPEIMDPEPRVGYVPPHERKTYRLIADEMKFLHAAREANFDLSKLRKQPGNLPLPPRLTDESLATDFVIPSNTSSPQNTRSNRKPSHPTRKLSDKSSQLTSIFSTRREFVAPKISAAVEALFPAPPAAAAPAPSPPKPTLPHSNPYFLTRQQFKNSLVIFDSFDNEIRKGKFTLAQTLEVFEKAYRINNLEPPSKQAIYGLYKVYCKPNDAFVSKGVFRDMLREISAEGEPGLGVQNQEDPIVQIDQR